MSKNKWGLAALTLLATPCYILATEPVEQAPATASRLASIRDLQSLLGFIKTLPQVEEFDEDDFNNRSANHTTAPDLKESTGGFGITVPRVAPDGQLDRYTLTTILNLKKGYQPVGFLQFWPTYAADARKLGHTEIADALDALTAVNEMERCQYHLRQLQQPSLNTKNAEELATFYKITQEEAQNLLSIYKAIPGIQGTVSTMGDNAALAKMTINEAKAWHQTQYDQKTTQYLTQIEAHQNTIDGFVARNTR